MRNFTAGWRALLLPLLLALSLSACSRPATEKPAAALPVATAAPTATAKAFVKLAIEDARKFEANPRDPSQPSTKNAANIGNKVATARVMGRLRSIYGGAGDDLVLPEGKTAASLVRVAAQKALTEKGYAVVDESAPQFATALPLRIDIAECWLWYSPGFIRKSLEFRAAVVMNGDALIAPATTAQSYTSAESLDVSPNRWLYVAEQGLDLLSAEIKARLKPAVEQ